MYMCNWGYNPLTNMVNLRYLTKHLFFKLVSAFYHYSKSKRLKFVSSRLTQLNEHFKSKSPFSQFFSFSYDFPMIFLWFPMVFPMANPRNRPPSAWPGTVLRRCWNRRRCWRCRRPALGQAFGTRAGEAWAVFGGEVCDVGWSYGSLNAHTHYIYIL